MKKFLEQIEVPETINENESHLIHVIIVEGNFNSQTLDTNYKAKTQMFDTKSWEGAEKRMGQLGYSHVFILHDPRVASKKAESNQKATTGGTEDAKEYRDNLIEKAKDLGYDGKLNAKNTVFEEFIAKAESKPKTTTKVLTQEDLDENPELVEQGLTVGDTIEIPEETEE